MIDKKQLEFKASRECRWDDFLGCPVVKNLLSKVGEVGLIPGWGAKILHTLQPKNQNIKQKQYGNKFNKDF